MTTDLIPPDVRSLYEVHEWKHACAVLVQDFPQHWADLLCVLRGYRLPRSHILEPGKEKSRISKAFERAFFTLGWAKKSFDTRVIVDAREINSPTHEVDCFRAGPDPMSAGVAVEIQWNNKDTFYDRDLNNFRLLFELRTVSVGIIITRCDELQELFEEVMGDRRKARERYGASTTHMSKLLPKLEGGGGGGCPILVFGITGKLYVED
ncbi:MAG: restriction endonuclease [Armatimonadetes bacterium]|nr:restriction endonuclease [Armatimonadota bacterium]